MGFCTLNHIYQATTVLQNFQCILQLGNKGYTVRQRNKKKSASYLDFSIFRYFKLLKERFFLMCFCKLSHIYQATTVLQNFQCILELGNESKTIDPEPK